MNAIAFKLVVLSLLGVSFAAEDIILTRVPRGVSGTGITTRYWDCCKPSCGWAANTVTNSPVATCEADGSTKADPEVQSGCLTGHAYMCNNQEPFAVNSTFAYGFVAASFSGGADISLCCACLQLEFQGGLSGKQMVVQITNTGGDLGSNQFDIAIPGGGVGIFTEGCQKQWNAPSSGWGDQYGGVGSASDCSQLPSPLQDGCRFRFDFMQGVSNPGVTFNQVDCPGQLTGLSGCA